MLTALKHASRPFAPIRRVMAPGLQQCLPQRRSTFGQMMPDALEKLKDEAPKAARRTNGP
ncbi:hypothetical protein [Bradyrhizobium sp. CCBAU 51765]|jgi:hypothetical protein|uniref:hypothetical protein n=1 Tax=Bradyrhizobium sp. CCBAU 51765 TaxID=1325102 RepID=UPI0018877713|nr:hypothetical protein [Bradyrhizobium sp. CCBAU 51765]QOZ09658.1 hypothetical protein XH96_20545 [Bradyrhizobium sp. CCBAU 51765]